jgi:hypothetical protein
MMRPRASDKRKRAAATVVDQESRKQHEQIEDGKQEQPVSRGTNGSGAHVQLQREQKEQSPTDRDGRAINRACKSEPPRQLRSQSKEAAVDQDLLRCCSPSCDNRQPGDAGPGIVIGAVEREGPEMGRCPKEDYKSRRGSRPACPVAAAHPITGGSAPAAPPMTMFCDAARFSQTV